uniref:Cytochrome c oxidase subunit 2 n=1 Tax=Camallanus cotti TaxID=375143 RepID=A0A343LEM5_9BILA|nr:cytochrome c oxidase subunit II [Camallanus cotti]ATO58499.1 cytochrome c oxidase subunit 2 [Camallanus cotti]
MFIDFGLGFLSSHHSMHTEWFYNFACSFLVVILIFVSMSFFNMMSTDLYSKDFSMNKFFIELTMSLIPIGILSILVFPSLVLLYDVFNLPDECVSVGVVGHQWYWTYDYSVGDGVSVDSYMSPVDELAMGGFRLLDVDNRCVVPCGLHVGFMITSDDVIHCWTLPSLSIKADALSGVLGHLICTFPILGVFYGQCSEICGAFHSFMPIVVESTLPQSFINWMYSR